MSIEFDDNGEIVVDEITSEPVKYLKSSSIQCYKCKSGKRRNGTVWLYLCQRRSGELMLKCKKCSFVIYIDHNVFQARPYDSIRFSSQQASIDECVRVMAELT